MNREASSRETQVWLWLFGKPAWELEVEDADVTEELADAIEHLQRGGDSGRARERVRG